VELVKPRQAELVETRLVQALVKDVQDVVEAVKAIVAEVV
jgi:hypothetical protein